jgi:hypothetical protein
MKTEDMIQLGALAVIGYLAWQKFRPNTPSQPVGTSSTPSVPVPSQATLPYDFGEQPGATWDDAPTPPPSSSGGITLVDAIIGGVT